MPRPFCRFIPACAGNAANARFMALAVVGSSPRVRGTPLRRSPTLARYGSSPRVRGTRADDLATSRRFIPACAGNARCQASVPGITVHPRVCGERDRGHSALRLDRRFIPACAGNAVRQPSTTSSVRFIPACAGNAFRADPFGRRIRFIPACAGNASNDVDAFPQPVHPRVCGERVSERRLGGKPGSSPRVRGTRDALRRRILSAVHPRVCGERAEAHDPAVAIRFIPACAGNAHNAAQPAACRFIPACAGNAPV